MDKLKKISVLFLLASSLFIMGCTEVSRGLGKITANKFAEPRSGSVWAVAPPQLEPPAPQDKTVYISYRNISDADIELLSEMRTAATAQGWTLVNDPTKAKYRLRASLRFFGEVVPESGGADVAAGMGVIAGAAVGVGVYNAGGRGTGSAVGGLAAGAATGSLVAAGLTNASRPREWALIVDFVLEEFSASPVEFTLSRGTESTTASGAGAANSRTAIGGGERADNSSSATITKKSNYYPHGVRLSVWANQMNMKEEEALPHVLTRTQKVITKLLPI